MTESIFDPDSDDSTRGGRFLGPPASTYSKMNPDLEDGKVESDEEMHTEVDCAAADADEPVCQIKRESKERELEEDPDL